MQLSTVYGQGHQRWEPTNFDFVFGIFIKEEQTESKKFSNIILGEGEDVVPLVCEYIAEWRDVI